VVADIDCDGGLALSAGDDASIFVCNAAGVNRRGGEVLRLEHRSIEGEITSHGISKEIDALCVDADEPLGVLDHAVENLGCSFLEVGVAGQLRSQ